MFDVRQSISLLRLLWIPGLLNTNGMQARRRAIPVSHGAMRTVEIVSVYLFIIASFCNSIL